MIGHQSCFPGCSRNLFFKTGFVMGNELHARGKNSRSTAIIDMQYNPLGIRIIPLKSKHNSRIRSSKAVDSLVIISHHIQIIQGRSHQAQDLILSIGHILHFIYQKIAETLLPLGKHLRMSAKQFPGFTNHIIEIQQMPPVFLLAIEKV